MASTLKVLLAQINSTVGAVSANADKIIKIISSHQKDYDLIVFPELALTGYPLEDVLFRPELLRLIQHNVARIEVSACQTHVIFGYPLHTKNNIYYNAARIISKGKNLGDYYKQHLPNYGVFDELRYFTKGEPKPFVFKIKNFKIGVCICEDLWQQGPIHQLIKADADIIVSINASPFDYEKYEEREKILRDHVKHGVSILYVNTVGGQDELVFDGRSLAIDIHGKITARARAFEEELLEVNIKDKKISGIVSPLLTKTELIYNALICGLRDYVQKNNFPGVIIGLSGGIDSALTLAIAVDALGSGRVHAVMMPSRYSLDISLEDAILQANIMQVPYTILPIEDTFKSILNTLSPILSKSDIDVTTENIQARIRGLFLMAVSNKTGKMVLATSNKSEASVGYATLYGDMVGGLFVLKDILKTEVYELARFRNKKEVVIPERVITRPPSAELRPNQKDIDTLPDYEILDGIIKLYMQRRSTQEIIEAGYLPKIVYEIISRIQHNEYKRRQSAPGIKISPCAYGRDWRYPLTMDRI